MSKKKDMIKQIINKVLSLLIVLFLGVSCNTKEKINEEHLGNNKTLFSLLTSDKTGIDFINKVKNQKDFNIFKYRNFITVEESLLAILIMMAL